MSLLQQLRDGSLGVSFHPPVQWKQLDENETNVHFQDIDRGIEWYLLWCPDVWIDLKPDNESTLRRDIAHHTRFLFETIFRMTPHAPHAAGGGEIRARTADAAWSPLIEVNRREINGRPTLEVLHRTVYEPGQELIMSHLLVPLPKGLFEIRLLAMARQTGYRESALLLMEKKLEGAIRGEFPDGLQSIYDDPKYDEGFPQHPLSRLRAAHRWLREGSGLSVLAAGEYETNQLVRLPLLRATFIPPPRFAALDEPFRHGEFRWHLFTRASFSGMEGVDRFLVQRSDEPIREHRMLQNLVEGISRRNHEESNLRQIQIRSERLRAHDGSDHVRVIVEGLGHESARRTVTQWFVADEYLWGMSIETTPAIPVEALTAEIQSAVASWQSTRASAATMRPWWKFWQV